MRNEKLIELYAAVEAVKELAENILDEAFDDANFSAMTEYIVKQVKDDASKTLSFIRDNEALVDSQK